MASTPAGRPVALKVVRPELSEDQVFRARFRQEIQAARRVHGLYTAQVLDADPAATPPWLVTAYVPGPSLQEAVAGNGPMPEDMAFRLVAGVAEALQAIHSAGVVHRDLKPSNVLLAPDGPRVIDFGIARALEATSLTRSGMMVGSPQFMAPEQILDEPVTPAIDVFALGSLAAYAVLGRPPFGEGHAAAVSYRVLHEAPDLTGCPAQLRPLIERCLRKDPPPGPRPAEILEYCLARTGGDRAAGPWPSQPPRAAAATTPPRSIRLRRGDRAAGPTAHHDQCHAAHVRGRGPRCARHPRRRRHGARPQDGGPAAVPGRRLRGVRAATTGALTVTIVGGLISVGVWLALARRTRRGRPGAGRVHRLVRHRQPDRPRHPLARVPDPGDMDDRRGRMGRRLIVIVFLWDRRSFTGYFAELQRGASTAGCHTGVPRPPAMPHRRP